MQAQGVGVWGKRGEGGGVGRETERKDKESVLQKSKLRGADLYKIRPSVNFSVK